MSASVNGRTALVCVDLQLFGVVPDRALCPEFPPGTSPEEYFGMLWRLVPRVTELQAVFRRSSLPILHLRIVHDGQRASASHSLIGVHVPPGSVGAEFLPSVAPEEGEHVIDKPTSGPWTSTNIKSLLEDLGVDEFVAVGVLADECVDALVRGGSDEGFRVITVSDAVGALSEERKRVALERLVRFGQVLTTDAAIQHVLNLDSV